MSFDFKVASIDSIKLFQYQIKEILTKENFFVETFSTFSSFIDTIESQPSLSYDLLIVSDSIIDEPFFKRFTTLKKRKRFLLTPVILTISNSNRKTVVRLINSGINDIIVKPIDSKFLLTRVRNVLANYEHLQGKKPSPTISLNFEDLINFELKRAARSKDPFSIIKIKPFFVEDNTEKITIRLQNFLSKGYFLIKDCLREVDMVLVTDDSIMIILPFTEAIGADTVLEKIKSTISKEINVNQSFFVKASLVSFPEHGKDYLSLSTHLSINKFALL